MTTEKPGAALYRCIMECLRERDEIERQARATLAEMDRKGELMNELPAAIAAALER